MWCESIKHKLEKCHKSRIGFQFQRHSKLLVVSIVIVGDFAFNIQTKCNCMQPCEPLFVLDRVRTGQVIYMFLFYCEQVSIAGQPGGVEAARVKIRVSWNSATFVLEEYSAQTHGPCSLVRL